MPDRRPPRRTTAKPDRWFEGFSARPADLARDLRAAWRRLRRAPGFALFTIVTLALGIGATTATYMAASILFSQPSGFADADRLAMVIADPRAADLEPLSWLDFQDLRTMARSMSAVEGEALFATSLTTNSGPTFVGGAFVTAGNFQALGATPLAGRLLVPSDDDPSGVPVIVLSESVWRLYFDSDPAVVGRSTSIGGRAYTVVGIAPRDFRGTTRFLLNRPAFWVAKRHAPLTDPARIAYLDASRRDRPYVSTVVRLQPGMDRSRLDGELSEIARQLDDVAPVTDRAGRPVKRHFTSRPVTGLRVAAKEIGITALVFLMPVLVLLVACTNLSNLVLSRGANRRNELLVRRALGASRWSLIRAELVEHGLLCIAGGVGGLVVARVLTTWGVATAVSALGTLPRTTQLDLRLDIPALAVALGATVLAIIVAALTPAVRLTRGMEGRPLGELAGKGRAGWLGQRHLLTFQVAGSVTLLLVTGILERQAMASTDRRELNIDLRRLAVVGADFALRTGDELRVLDDISRILFEASDTGGIDSAAVATRLPSLETNSFDGPSITRASGGIFRVLGLPLCSGRTFLDGETGNVAVLSESAAREAFGTTDVVGRVLSVPTGLLPGPMIQVRVVGVVGDAGRDRVTHGGLRQVYLPFAPIHDPARTVTPPVWFVARSTGGAGREAASTLTALARRVEPDLPIRFSGPADAFADGEDAMLRFVAMLLSGLALVAVVLSASGLYAVTSQLVVNRTREMGIRAALGADRAAIVRLVLRDAVRPVIIGIATGLGLCLTVWITMRRVFDDWSVWHDSLLVLIALTPLVVATVAACYVPARHAARIDPNEALRQT